MYKEAGLPVVTELHSEYVTVILVAVFSITLCPSSPGPFWVFIEGQFRVFMLGFHTHALKTISRI